MYPDTTRPPQADHGHGDLINAVYRAIHEHPDAEHMAEYGDLLAKLLRRQAKTHALAKQQSPPQMPAHPGAGIGRPAGEDYGAPPMWETPPPLPISEQLALVNPRGPGGFNPDGVREGFHPEAMLAALRQQLVG